MFSDSTGKTAISKWGLMCGGQRIAQKLFLLAVIAAGLGTFYGCGKKDFLKGPMRISDTENPTVKAVELSLKDTVPVALRIRNLGSGKMHFLEGLTQKDTQKILLAGLKPDQDYSLDLLHEGEVVSGEVIFHTAPIDSNLVGVVEKANTPNAFDGYVLTQKKGAEQGLVYLIDNESDVVWYQPVPGIPKLAQLSENGEVIVLLGDPKDNNSAGDRILAYTFDGRVSYDIDLRPKNLMAHHEVLEHQGDLYTLIYDTIPNQVNGSLERAVSSAVVRLNKEGEVLWKWSTFDVVQPAGVSVKEMDGDWGHANAFAFDADNNLLISYRDWNQVWKVDVKTGARIWVLGEEGDFEMEGVPFDAQHAIVTDAEGNYMLFDNGRKKRQTRIVSYKLESGKANAVVMLPLPADLFSVKMGNAGVLPNGNFLVCAPGSASVVVMDPGGTILYHVTTGLPSPYRATFVPPFYSSR